MITNDELNKNEKSGILLGWFNKQAENFEKTRFGFMALFITIQSCLGSIACMRVLQAGGNNAMLITCAVITMLSNSLFIAQGEAKWCIGMFYSSLLINTALILISL